MDEAVISGAADQLRPPSDEDAAAAEHLPEVQRLVSAVRAYLTRIFHVCSQRPAQRGIAARI